jgi:hypothetical protein
MAMVDKCGHSHFEIQPTVVFMNKSKSKFMIIDHKKIKNAEVAELNIFCSNLWK